MRKIEMDRKQQILLWRIVLSGLLAGIACVPGMAEWMRIAFFAVAYLAAGYDVVWKAVTHIIRGKVFDEHFLMMIATSGAFGIGDWAEAVAVMAFYQIGELFQDVAVDRSRKSIRELTGLKPDSALVEQNGTLSRVNPDEVPVGSTIVIEPGERIPLDGVVTVGESSLDTAALTGESMPRDVGVGDKVLSGSMNINGVLRVCTTASYGQSTAARILSLIENAENGKAPAEKFITRFARWYTPAVVTAALLLFIIPPLFIGHGWMEWLNRALIFLVISCPCALVVSIPLTFFAGIGGAARRKILVKGSAYFEALAKVDTMVFDKTGTLTEGHFSVSSVVPADGVDSRTLLRLAAAAESYSNHPVAMALRDACKDNKSDATDVREYPGEGVAACVDGQRIFAGNPRLMHRCGCSIPENVPEDGTIVFIAADNRYLGYIAVSDTVKPEAASALDALRKEGVENFVMLTGDRPAAAALIAHGLNIADYRASLLPQDKVRAIEEIERGVSRGRKVAFVGDGINDAPSLALADVGIAMGAVGSDAAIEAADIVLGNDSLDLLPQAVHISRHTLAIVWQNIIIALGIKTVMLLLAAFGVANMWEAVFADVGVTVLAVLNALRALGRR